MMQLTRANIFLKVGRQACIFLVLGGLLSVVVQAKVKDNVLLQALGVLKTQMTQQEFTDAGLSKLSGDELKFLDTWLQKRTYDIVQALMLKEPSTDGQSVVETTISGAFSGWSGDTIWKMDNGQIWQQSEYSYTYHYAYRPSVLIFRSGGGWKMRVDGLTEQIGVKLLK